MMLSHRNNFTSENDKSWVLLQWHGVESVQALRGDLDFRNTCTTLAISLMEVIATLNYFCVRPELFSSVILKRSPTRWRYYYTSVATKSLRGLMAKTS